jgi:hexosaminidase
MPWASSLVKPYNPTYQGLITPETIYNQNKTILDIPAAASLQKIIPTPVNYQEKYRELYHHQCGYPIVSDPLFENEKRYFINGIEKLLGSKLKGTSATKKIVFKKDAALGAEAYNLNITPDGMTISAATPAGLFYGIQSFKTSLSAAPWAKAQAAITVPCLEVTDAPALSLPRGNAGCGPQLPK